MACLTGVHAGNARGRRQLGEGEGAVRGGWAATSAWQDAGNGDYGLCPTYPSLCLLPRVPGLTTEVIEASAGYRSKGRLPVLAWASTG